MMPLKFEGSNTVMEKPANMTDEQCFSVHAFRGVDDEKFPYVMTVWQPNKEDIEAINEGRPICVKQIGTSMQPMAIWTYDKNFNPNA